LIAVDTNVLVYASRTETEFHEPAVRLITQLAESERPWAIPWPCVYEYLRVMTHPRLFKPPSTQTEAISRLNLLSGSPSLTFIGHGPLHFSALMAAAEQSGAKGNLFFDVQIAAICREHGITEILTMDRDFSRFSGIKVRRPF
jgi:toxin-antitoxin system PIN domain toxin